MNKRQAMRHAHDIAWQLLESAAQQGAIGEDLTETLNAEDQGRVTAALDELAQRHFDRSRTQNPKGSV